MIVHLARRRRARRVGGRRARRRARRSAGACWPGPLTLVLRRVAARARRGHRRAATPSALRVPDQPRRARAAARVRRRRRGAVGEPVRAGEPDDRRRRARRPRRRRRPRARRRAVPRRRRVDDRRLHRPTIPVILPPRRRRARARSRQVLGHAGRDARPAATVARARHARRRTTRRARASSSSTRRDVGRRACSAMLAARRARRRARAEPPSSTLPDGRDRRSARPPTADEYAHVALRACSARPTPRASTWCSRSRRPTDGHRRRGRRPAAAAAARRRRGRPVTRRPIGVFDSGLGGLTVLRALIDLLPDERDRLLRRHRPVPVRARSRATRC